MLKNYVEIRPAAIGRKVQRYVLKAKQGKDSDLNKHLVETVRDLYSHNRTRRVLGDLIPKAWDRLGFKSEADAWTKLNDQFYPDSKSKLERGEFGECVSYAVFEEFFGSEIPAKKLWYGKTSSKQPVFGKDVLALRWSQDGHITNFYLIEVKTSLDIGSLSGNISDLERTLDEYTAATWIKELDQLQKTQNLAYFSGKDAEAKLMDLFLRWEQVDHCCLIVLDSAVIPESKYDVSATAYVGRLAKVSTGMGRKYLHVLVLAHPGLEAWAASIYKKGGICRV